MLCQLGSQDAANIRRSILPFTILLSLRSKPAYAYELTRRLRDAHELAVAESDLYGCLKRLRRRELVSFRWETSESGPPRKIYNLTESGLVHLNNLSDAWRTLAAAISHLAEHETSGSPNGTHTAR